MNDKTILAMIMVVTLILVSLAGVKLYKLETRPECEDGWCKFIQSHPRMAACFEYSGKAMFSKLKYSHGIKPEYCDRMEQTQ